MRDEDWEPSSRGEPADERQGVVFRESRIVRQTRTGRVLAEAGAEADKEAKTAACAATEEGAVWAVRVEA